MHEVVFVIHAIVPLLTFWKYCNDSPHSGILYSLPQHGATRLLFFLYACSIPRCVETKASWCGERSIICAFLWNIPSPMCLYCLILPRGCREQVCFVYRSSAGFVWVEREGMNTSVVTQVRMYTKHVPLIPGDEWAQRYRDRSPATWQLLRFRTASNHHLPRIMIKF